MSIKLSICLPTYNRGNMLRQCLDSILSADNFIAQLIEENIEILISDNASIDNTQEIISEYKEVYPQIRYHRNQINIGAEKNFYLLAQMAKGEYIWILGDDDRVTPDSIKIILENIKSGYNMLLVNYSIWTKDFLKMRKSNVLSINNNRKTFENADELMKNLGIHLGYISSVIVKKALFLKVPQAEYDFFSEYGFSFLYAIYFGLLNECKAIFISTALIWNRTDNSGGYNWFKYFVIGSSKIFNKLGEMGYTRNAVHAAKKTVIRDFLIYKIIDSKLDKNDEFKKNIKDMFDYYQFHASFWVFCVPLIYMPRMIIVFLKKLKRKFKR